MNARIGLEKLNETIATTTVKKNRPRKNDPWKQALDRRRREAIQAAVTAYELTNRLYWLAREAHDADPDHEDLEHPDAIISKLGTEAERAIINLILEPQQDLAPPHSHNLARVRCRPAAAVVGSKLYIVTPAGHSCDDNIGDVAERENAMVMHLHVVDLEDIQRHG